MSYINLMFIFSACVIVCVYFPIFSFGGAVAPVWPHRLKDWKWRQLKTPSIGIRSG